MRIKFILHTTLPSFPRIFYVFTCSQLALSVSHMIYGTVCLVCRYVTENSINLIVVNVCRVFNGLIKGISSFEIHKMVE